MADTINPNIPDIVVVSGATVPVTDDPRWIDGGIHYSSPDFNLDNPAMWTPMSVISGLASGFCERAAYVTGGTVLGLQWVNAAPKENASNATQAQKTANNIALAGAVTSIFTQTQNPDFLLPVNTPFSNYMAAFDDALETVLLASDGGYKTITGGTYTFSSLATAAYVRAAGDIEQPSRGGWSYREPFDYTYPAQWAKERKWMLEELKYTGTISPKHPITAIQAYHATSNGDDISGETASIGTEPRSTLYSSLVLACDGATDDDIMQGYHSMEVGFQNRYTDSGNTRTEYTKIQGGRVPIILVARLTDVSLDNTNHKYSFYLDYGRTGGLVFDETSTLLVSGGVSLEVTDYSPYGGESGNDREGYTILAGGTVHISPARCILDFDYPPGWDIANVHMGVLNTASDGLQCVPLDGRHFPMLNLGGGKYYLKPDNEFYEVGTTIPISGYVYTVGPAVVNDSTINVLCSGSIGNYVPVSGTTSTITSSYRQLVTCISSGGTLAIDEPYSAGAHLQAINLMTGGNQLILGVLDGDPYPNICSAAYVNYFKCDDRDYAYPVYTTNVTSMLASGGFDGVLLGCTATLNASAAYTDVNVYVLSGGLCNLTGTGGVGQIGGSIHVCSGGSCNIDNITDAGNTLAVTVENCGTCSIGPNIYLGPVIVYTDGVCNIDLGGTSAYIDNGLHVYQGATVNIENAVMSGGILQYTEATDGLSITAYICETFGLENMSRGWNYGTLKETDIDPETSSAVCYLGAPVAGSTPTTNEISGAILRAGSAAQVATVASGAIVGTIKVSSTGSNNPNVWTWDQIFNHVVGGEPDYWRGVQLKKSLMAVAYNGGELYKLDDHYQSFRCRQFYTNPDNPTPVE